MFSHVTVGSNDLEKSRAFYSLVLETLGVSLLYDLPEKGWLGYGVADDAPMCWIGDPYVGKPATFGNGVTVGFSAPDRQTVDAFHAAALANGGSDEGAPGLRPHYDPDCYAAYVRDPDGNKLCCECMKPE